MGVGSGKDPHGQRQRRSSRGSLERTSDGAHIVKISLRVVADRQTLVDDAQLNDSPAQAAVG